MSDNEELANKSSDDDEVVEAGSDAKKVNKKKERKKKKKEAEKAEKAAKTADKTAPPPAAESASKTMAEEPAADDDNENEDGDDDKAEEGGADKKKVNKKKERKAKKKEAEAAAKDDPKKKKRGGQADLIKQFLAAKEKAEEEARRAAEEEEARLEALRKAREDEDKKKQEAKDAKKLREKERIEAEKAAGTYMTPAQREKWRIQQQKLAAMNVVLPVPTATETTAAEDGKKPKRVVYENKKKKPTQQQTTAQPKPDDSTAPVKAEKKVTAQKVTPQKSVETADVDDVTSAMDDWELAEDESPEADVTSLEESPVPETGAPQQSSSGEEDDESEDEEESDDEEDGDEEEDDDEDDESEDEQVPAKETKEEMLARIANRLKRRRAAADEKKTLDLLRAPVICVLGHVDTGKTKMLDTIRRTHVQDAEAGGITQQIGATEVPADAIAERCKHVTGFDPAAMKIPGLLIIDTPGHESFANLRSRGSSLCDFAILVVDIMHGLEPQTIESLKLLLKRQTPFVIALNKIDRIYDWVSNPRKDVWALIRSQKPNAQLEFKERYDKIVTEFAEQSVNVALANANPDPNEYVSIVPTSAMVGDGIGNIMAHIVQEAQTRHAQRLQYSTYLDATVMEVKVIAGLGTTIDVILVNGKLRVGDFIILSGTDGAISTQIREILTPQPLREIRVKGEYIHHKEIKGAIGVKLLAKNLEKALAGLPLYVVKNLDELPYIENECEAQLSKALTSIKRKPEGVYVQASTLGSLEALLEFLKTQKIPYSNVNIGPVHKRDVQKAAAMLEHNSELACILAFDVRIERDAQQYADQEGVRIFQADIIYHLEDAFLKHREDLRLKARKDNEHLAVFPCKLRILPQHIFNARNPIVVGVSVEAGQLKKGTPICVPSKDRLFIGTVASIQRNHDEVELAKTGEEVCVKIENTTGDAPRLYGRHFDYQDTLVSRISRESIDVCKQYFRDDLSKADWTLIVQLKKLLDII